MKRKENILDKLKTLDKCECQIHGVYINGLYYDWDEADEPLEECYDGTVVFITGSEWILKVSVENDKDYMNYYILQD